MNESAAGVAVGIDVSKLKLDVCVVDGTKGDIKLKYKVVKNTRSGHGELIAWLLQRRLPADVPVVLEATGPYSEAPRHGAGRCRMESKCGQSGSCERLCSESAQSQQD